MRKDAPIVAIFRAQIVRKDQIVLNDISIEIEKGSWIEICAQSGSGKTDLFNALSLRKKIKIGQVVVSGMNLDKMDEKALANARTRIGSCGQFPIFLESESLINNLIFPAMIHGKTEVSAREEALQILDAFDLVLAADIPMQTLDHDDRSIAAIARAFVSEPKIILIDSLLSTLSIRALDLVFRQLNLVHLGGTTIVVFDRKINTSSDALIKDSLKERFQLNRNGIQKIASAI